MDIVIEKWADLSHAIKNFGSRPDEAKTTHPKLKNSKVVAYIIFLRPSSQIKMSPEGIATSLMNTSRHFLVIMSPVVTSAKLNNPAEYRFKGFPRVQARSLQQYLGELFSRYTDVPPLCMLCNIYRCVITCTWIYLDLLDMWGVQVMTNARCRVGTVPAIASASWLVTSTHTHRCHLN